MTTVVAILLILTGSLQSFASTLSSPVHYLHIVEGTGESSLMFNGKGVLIEETTPPQIIDEGFVVLSDREPAALKSSDVTIVLQKESLLSIISNSSNNLHYYLIGGTASFLTSPAFNGKMTVTTPVGSYTTRGPAELFVSSDLSELVFSLGGSVAVTNTISREKTQLSPYHYLDLADPFLKGKPISQNTFKTLSMNPQGKSLSLMPSSSISDPFNIASTSEAFEIAQKEAEPEVMIETPSPAEVMEPAAAPEKTPEVTSLSAEEEKPAVVSAAPEAEKEEPAAEPPEPAAPAKELIAQADKLIQNIYIAHTSDGAGARTESNISYEKLATLAKWGRATGERTLLLDAGNTIGGSEYIEFDQGRSDATLLEMVGYDAIAPGTSEFRFPVEYLVSAAAFASENGYLDVLSSNAIDASGNSIFEPYAIYDLDGVSVGVIGLSAPEHKVDSLTFYSEQIASHAQALVDEVNALADVVIVLGTIPASSPISSTDIVNAVEGIDLFIDGAGASLPSGGIRVGDTLIVGSDAMLASIGIVEMTLTDGNITSSAALSLDADAVRDPSTSPLAAAYGVTSIPADAEIAAYLDSVEMAYRGTLQTPSVEEETGVTETAVTAMPAETAGEKSSVPAPAAVTPEKTPASTPAETESITVKPASIITADTAETPALSEFGVSLSYESVKVGVASDSAIYNRLSINPFITLYKGQLGLQAYYMTNETLLDFENAPYANYTFGEGTFALVQGILGFIDYFYYGDENDPFFVVMDRETPITFSHGYIANNLGITGNVFEQKLGLYGKAMFGKFGAEVFVDDMYLSALGEGNQQHGGVRFFYDFSDTFSLGLGTVVSINRSISDVTAYPTLDTTFTLSDTRKMRSSLFIGATTAFDVIPFSLDPLYNADGTDLQTILPNYQLTAGLDFNFEKLDMRITGSLIHATDPILAYGSLNSTPFSGERMIDASSPYVSIGFDSAYKTDNLTIGLSYALPIAFDFSRIMPLSSDASTYADMFDASITYDNGTFRGALGFQRIGFLTGISNLFVFDSGISGFLSDAVDFATANLLANPYLSLSYTKDLLEIYSDLFFMDNGNSALRVGTEITIGKVAAKEAQKPAGTSEKDSPLHLGIGATYHSVIDNDTDALYISLVPSIGYTGENFELTLAPSITIDPVSASLKYTGTSSPFTFGTGGASTFETLFDLTSDVAALIDTVKVGNEEDVFSLSLTRDTRYSSGTLLRGMDAAIDSELQKQLALDTRLNTSVFDAYLYVNNLSMMQMADAGISLTPFASYQAELSVSSIFEAYLPAGSKRIFSIPTVALSLPLIGKTEPSLSLVLSGSALLSYDQAGGFDLLSYDATESSLLGRFKNYLAYAGIEFVRGSFEASLGASTQNGVLSQGMYNSLYLRERGSLITDLNKVWDSTYVSAGRDYEASASAAWNNDNISFEASYILPFSADFTPTVDDDLISLNASMVFGDVRVGVDYARTGFADAVSTLSGSASLLSGLQTFLLANESYGGITAALTVEDLELSTRFGTYTSFTSDGTYNGLTAGTTEPLLSIGLNLQF